MGNLSKRSTVYFDPEVYQALKIEAASTQSSISEIVDEAVRLLMLEDQEDLEAIADRMAATVITYDALLKDLKRHGRI